MMVVSLITACLLTFFISCNGLRCWECNNAKTNEECLSKGVLKTCVEENAICEDQIRHGDFGRNVIIEKRCKQSHACDNNVIQNLRRAYPIQCNTKSPTSVCRCCCNQDECNRDLLSCWGNITQYKPPEQNKCKPWPLKPRHGEMQCYGNMEIGTYCTFWCHPNYFLRGQSRVTCLNDLTWDYPVPTCEEMTCPPARVAPVNGAVSCSNGINLASQCRRKKDENVSMWLAGISTHNIVGVHQTLCETCDEI